MLLAPRLRSGTRRGLFRFGVPRRITLPRKHDPAALQIPALRALAELAAESDGEFVPAHRVSSRLGRAPGLGIALEQLFERGLTERGCKSDGGWGDRPTEAGYEQIAVLGPWRAAGL
jgi:hypothetical protein